MNKFQAKKAGLERRKRRVRGKVTGTADRPRLAVHRTNAHIYAQVIDDVDGKTICAASTLDPEFRATGKLGSQQGGCCLRRRARRQARRREGRHHGPL